MGFIVIMEITVENLQNHTYLFELLPQFLFLYPFQFKVFVYRTFLY